jgi:hypothetical protein
LRLIPLELGLETLRMMKKRRYCLRHLPTSVKFGMGIE